MVDERRLSADGEKMPHRKTFFNSSTHKSITIYRHTYSSNKDMDMTEGSVLYKIFLFAIPLIISNLLQRCYNAADMMIVGLSPEANAVGAIGVTGSFVNMLVNICMGAATGANVVVARYLGAKNDEMASRTAHTSILASLGFGTVCAAIGLCISRPVLSLMGATENLLELATTYTQIYFLGLPFVSLVNYLISIFRAKGDTKTPLYILSFSGILNVLLNLFFVLVCKMSVEGVAHATNLANIISAVLLIVKLRKDDSACRFSFKKLCFDKGAFSDILRIGLPAAVQGSLFSISGMLIQSSIIRMNYILTPAGSSFDPVVSGSAASTSIEGFAYTAQNAIYQAAITFTSQNVGAKKYNRIYKIMASCYLVGALIASVFSISMYFLRTPLFALYGIHPGIEGSAEAIAYSTASIRTSIIFIPYAFVSFMEVGCAIVRGLGKSTSSTIISLIGSCVFRVLWILVVFNSVVSLESIYISFPISWIITGLVFFIYSLLVLKKTIKAQNAETVGV